MSAIKNGTSDAARCCELPIGIDIFRGGNNASAVYLPVVP
jgi:hypothetical protein